MILSSFRPGEANVPAVLLSTAVLILSIAAAFYVIVILPFQGDDDTSANSSSSSASSMMSSAGMPAAQSVSSRAFDQAAYEGCLTASTEAHTQRWTAACLQHRETQESAYLACVNQGKGRDYCKGQFGGYEEIDANCVLPAARTTALTLQFEVSKEACDRQYGR